MKTFAAALAILAIAAPASAGVVASRTALDALLGANQTLETFENLPTGNVVPLPDTLDSTTVIEGSAGHVVAGVTFTSPEMFEIGGGYYGVTGKTIGDSIPSRPITATFTASVNAIGFDIQGYSGYNTGGTAKIYDTTGALLTSLSTGLGFFGFESTDGIGSIVWQSDGYNSYLMIDNLGFGSVAADVPEPAMLGLFGLGALGLAAARRRRAA